jgi:uncharacterized protein YgbK (DUF1537 family)
MPNQNGLVLADDATGALECASLLAGLELDASIAISDLPVPLVAQGIRVVDTESRHLSPENAAIRIRQWLIPIQANQRTHVFKKTDSTLRGNIAAELVAMLAVTGSRPIVYVPAYPALGRTVHEGTLFVRGIPVAETEFGDDARDPVHSSQIVDLFPRELRHLIITVPHATALAAALGRRSSKILICDAASNDDLQQLASVLQETAPLAPVASPAGFIRAWAALGSYPRRVPPAFPQPKKWLVVCGSRHPQSRRQSGIAEASGLHVIQSGMDTMHSPELVASGLAGQALAFIGNEKPDAVLIMGGDTVRALWRAMGLTALIPLPELLPGIAACVSPDGNLLFVTKAGGFGDDRLVEQILERFKRA